MRRRYFTLPRHQRGMLKDDLETILEEMDYLGAPPILKMGTAGYTVHFCSYSTESPRSSGTSAWLGERQLYDDNNGWMGATCDDYHLVMLTYLLCMEWQLRLQEDHTQENTFLMEDDIIPCYPELVQLRATLPRNPPGPLLAGRAAG